jgi:glyoxylate reductase
MKPGVLVTRHVFEPAIDVLRPLADVDYRDAHDGASESELASRLAGRVAMVCQLTDPITARLLDRAPSLRLVANIAVGYDNIDVTAASERGILVTNTPDVLTETTADFAFALLLAAARRVVEGDRFVRAGKWRAWTIDLLAGEDVHGRTLGIVGMGRIGSAMVRRALGFGMRIVYTSRREHGIAGATRLPLSDLLAASDFVSLHVPLTAETRHLIGADELARMKPTAFLVNTARGPIVDEAALVRALRDRTIAGAALDVFEREPELAPGLAELPNVVLAPHLGSASVATRTRMCTLAAENVAAWLRGADPPNAVNRDAVAKR